MTMLDIHQILKRLPHRYPILLVDRVLELEKGKRIKALKNVTINEPFFEGALSAPPGDARGADARGAGAGRGAAVLRDAGQEPDDETICTSSASTARASSARSSRATS
jgi:3-hydroxyacyl-[acyl-carrier-protein] dehydratase